MIARLRALATSPTTKAAVLLGFMGWATGKLMELATEQQQLHQQLTAAIADGAQELQRLTVQRLALKEEMGLAAERTEGDVDPVPPNGYPACRHRPQVRYYDRPCAECAGYNAEDDGAVIQRGTE